MLHICPFRKETARYDNKETRTSKKYKSSCEMKLKGDDVFKISHQVIARAVNGKQWLYFSKRFVDASLSVL